MLNLQPEIGSLNAATGIFLEYGVNTRWVHLSPIKGASVDDEFVFLFKMDCDLAESRFGGLIQVVDRPPEPHAALPPRPRRRSGRW